MAAKKEADSVAPTTAVAKVENAIQARPEWLPQGPAQGFEEMETKDITLPRLSLAQSMTPATKRNNEAYIEGLVEGLFFNTLTKEIYGDEVVITPLFFFKNRIMFKDLAQGGGILCQAPAPRGDACQLNKGGPCLHQDFGAEGERPECSEFFNYPSFIHNGLARPELIVCSFKSTQLRRAKDWNASMRALGPDMFAQKWRIKVVADRKDKFDFWNVEFSHDGWVDQAFYKGAKEMFEGLRAGVKGGTVKVDQTGLADEDKANSIPTTATSASAEM